MTTVYSNERTKTIPQNPLPDGLLTNQRVAMDGLTFMSKLPEECIAAVFFDPQYRGVLDKLSYGNEGVAPPNTSSSSKRLPRRAKGIWTRHDIPDVWEEKVPSLKGVHPKPVALQQALIEATTAPRDPVLDPAAGSFSVLKACQLAGRTFVGCDVNG